MQLQVPLVLLRELRCVQGEDRELCVQMNVWFSGSPVYLKLLYGAISWAGYNVCEVFTWQFLGEIEIVHTYLLIDYAVCENGQLILAPRQIRQEISMR